MKWYVEKGQKVKVGDPIVEMETDKVVADIPAPRDGVIVERFGKVGDVINVDDPLVEIEIEGVDGEEAQKIATEKPAPAHDEEVEEKGFGVVGQIEVAGEGAFLPASEEGVEEKEETKPKRKKALATPVARAMARDLGIDIHQVPGTGPAGRVTKQDIQNYYKKIQQGAEKLVTKLTEEPEEPQIEYQPLSQIRKTIAKNMILSKTTAAHMAVFEEVEISRLVELRKEQKEKFAAQGVKLTYLPFIIKALVLALKKYPIMNGELDLENNRIVIKKFFNIGIAVDTDEGLVVPVIKNADQLSIVELAKKLEEFAIKARERKLTLDDLRGGTFSITNYGAIGGIFGYPVINYPQAAILGIGRILKTPVVKGDEIAVGYVLPLSLSVDHRLIDGGTATRFLNEIMSYLSDPVSLLLQG
jgi:pyruvate dehydrogenase E2 component (dihydrolipoamide acetyltransferase)